MYLESLSRQHSAYILQDLSRQLSHNDGEAVLVLVDLENADNVVMFQLIKYRELVSSGS